MSTKTNYYGSDSLHDTLSEGLNPALTGIGKNNSLGSGFYFYADPFDAEKNIGEQGLRVSNPAIISGIVELTSPIVLPVGATSIRDTRIEISSREVFRIISRNKRVFDDYDSPLTTWGGAKYNRVTKELVNTVCAHYAQPEHFWDLEKEFFGELGESQLFRSAVADTLGFDGVKQELGNGLSNMVAWFPEQVSHLDVHRVLAKPECPSNTYPFIHPNKNRSKRNRQFDTNSRE